MASRTERPLSTEEAKLRLLDAADDSSPAALVRLHPTTALAFAFSVGILVARSSGMRRFVHSALDMTLRHSPLPLTLLPMLLSFLHVKRQGND